MSRLTHVSPRIAPLGKRIASAPSVNRDRARDQVQAWRAWYKTARWQRLRWDVLVRAGFQCECGCGRIEADSSLLVADHIRPHRGDERLFWDIDNLQCLTKHCHDSAKQASERRAHRS